MVPSSTLLCNLHKNFLTKNWDSDIQRACSLCDETFSPPGIPAQLRKSVQENPSSSSEQQGARTGEVLCDICNNRKALKSCLVCLSSYCETHVELHLKIPGLRRHKLTRPVENLEDQMWEKYEKANRRLETIRRFFSKLRRCVYSCWVGLVKGISNQKK